MPEGLVELNDAVETIPVTSADAELGFSTMNVICSSLRNWLGVQRAGASFEGAKVQAKK